MHAHLSKEYTHGTVGKAVHMLAQCMHVLSMPVQILVLQPSFCCAWCLDKLYEIARVDGPQTSSLRLGPCMQNLGHAQSFFDAAQPSCYVSYAILTEQERLVRKLTL